MKKYLYLVLIAFPFFVKAQSCEWVISGKSVGNINSAKTGIDESKIGYGKI